MVTIPIKEAPMKHFPRLFLFFAALCTLLTACGGSTTTSGSGSTPTPAPINLNVFAAASLTESFTEMANTYHQQHPNVIIKLNFNGSQILEQQIANGAPADIFASADLTNMQKASNAGLVNASQIFVKNRLVVIIPASNPGNINSLKDLTRKGIKIDIEAKTVPAGNYTRQVLANMSKSADYGSGFGNAVLANVVSEETNVKAVVQKVQLGEADAGFVYRSDVTAAVANKLQFMTIPTAYNVTAQYPIAVVKSSTHSSDAQAFIDFVLSTAGQDILQKYHFIPLNA
jgi:molybdate transport system substrate-binding protein